MGLGLSALAGFASAASAAKSPKSRTLADVAANFRELAQQRPWQCKQQQDFDLPRQWKGGQAQCAWQDRLRMRQWLGPAGALPGECVSVQARWWGWARHTAAPGAHHPVAWQSSWTSQSLVDESGAEKRVLLMQPVGGGRWSTTEWRWLPSTRLATRRWQESRWSQLKARVASARQPAEPAAGSREMRVLREVLLANVGSRVAEISGDVLNYQASGLCLQIDAASPGQQQLQVPYLPEDSRLEQRAAMQLQLARRFPRAVWLTPFTLIAAPPAARGGAKFYAAWVEGAVMKGQLWIPTKSDGPLVRVRITTVLPGPVAAQLARQQADARQTDAPAVTAARQVVTTELTGLANGWTSRYE